MPGKKLFLQSINFDARKFVFLTVLIFFQTNSLHAHASWKCILTLGLVSGASETRSLSSEQQRELERTLGDRTIKQSHFNKLFFTDGIAFEEALSASKVVRMGLVDIKQYRALRKQGASHDQAMSGQRVRTQMDVLKPQTAAHRIVK